MLQPYIKSTQIFACPSNTGNTLRTFGSGPIGGAGFEQGPGDAIIPRSYSINGSPTNIGGTPVAGDDGNSASLASIGSVSQVLLVGESGPTWPWPEMNTGGTPDEFADSMFGGHLGQSNFLFADGHVKSQKPTATGAPVNMWTVEDNGAAPPELTERLNAWTVKINR